MYCTHFRKISFNKYICLNVSVSCALWQRCERFLRCKCSESGSVIPNIIKACYCGAAFLKLKRVDDPFALRCHFTLLQFVCFGLYSLPLPYFKTPLACLPFYFALLLFVDLSIQLVYLGSEVLTHFVPLRLQCWSKQAILDSEQFSMEVDSLHLERKKTHIVKSCCEG